MIPGDRARATVFVRVEPELAFEVFTSDIDRWWRRGIKFRHSGKQAGVLHFEPGLGGRLFETFEVNREQRLIVVGSITAWEPPARVQFEWRNANFAPHESTEVEVRFIAKNGGTEVSVEHRGWSALRPGHPARHGLEGAAFSGMIGMWWGELMTAYRERFEADRTTGT
jgi:uncharacterized protein YndB with AHSA1/START domain